jgi:adenylate kinase
MRLLIVGPPGAGKGTQGSRLSEVLGVPHVSSGSVLRQAVKDRTPAGLRIGCAIGRGELVPDEIVIELLRERFGAADVASDGYLLDGFPRTVDQLRRLPAADPHGAIDAVVHLVVPEAVVRERLQRRKRPDDRPSVLRTRWAEHRRFTVPMLAELERVASLVVVDAVQPIDEVTEDILVGLDRVGVRSSGTGALPGEDGARVGRSRPDRAACSASPTLDSALASQAPARVR